MMIYFPDVMPEIQDLMEEITSALNFDENIENDVSLEVHLICLSRLIASTIRKRLGSFSRKNRLYFAFREIGRAVRTIFLLSYISDPAMRSLIQGGINKSEGFNLFTQ